MDCIIYGSITACWGSAHSCTRFLVEVAITELKYVVLHDQFEGVENCWNGEVAELCMGVQKLGDCSQSRLCVNVRIHTDRVCSEKLCARWKARDKLCLCELTLLNNTYIVR